MKKHYFLLFGLLLGAIVLNAQASTVTISPADCIENTNCFTTDLNGGNDQDVYTQLAGLTLIYKDSPDDGESGSAPLKDSYTTVFNSDNSGATISYDGGDIVDCSDPCWFVVKDGNHSPARYLFNLALSPFGWDGQMDLVLSGFWPAGGAISHVAFYGGTTVVPVPAAFWLFGTALIGFIGISRRTKV